MRHLIQSLLLSATVLVFSHQAFAGVFQKIYEEKERGRREWTRILAEGFDSNKTNSEILKAFKKPDAEILATISAKKMARPQYKVTRWGDFILVNEGSKMNTILVVDTFPDLSLLVNGETIRFPLSDKAKLNNTMKEWMKTVDAERFANFGNLFFAEANAEGDTLLYVTLAGVGAAVGYETGYTDGFSAGSRSKGPDLSGITRELGNLSRTQAELVKINNALAAVRIPNELMDLSQKLDQTGSKDISREIQERVARDSEAKYGGIYSDTLMKLRTAKDTGLADFGACKERKEGEGNYSEIRSKSGEISAQRRAIAKSSDVKEMKIGDLTIKVTSRPKDPSQQFNLRNEQSAAAKACRNSSCKDVPINEIGGIIANQIHRKFFQKFPTEELARSVTGLSSKLADLKKDSSCEKTNTVLGKLNFSKGLVQSPNWREHQWGEGEEKRCFKDNEEFLTAVGTTYQEYAKGTPFGIHSPSRFFRYLNGEGCKIAIANALDKLTPEQRKELAAIDFNAAPKDFATCKMNTQRISNLASQLKYESSILEAAQTYQATIHDDSKVAENNAAFNRLLSLGQAGDVNYLCGSHGSINRGRMNDGLRGGSFCDPSDVQTLEKTPIIRQTLSAFWNQVAEDQRYALEVKSVMAAGEMHANCCHFSYCQAKLDEVLKANAAQNQESGGKAQSEKGN